MALVNDKRLVGLVRQAMIERKKIRYVVCTD